MPIFVCYTKMKGNLKARIQNIRWHVGGNFIKFSLVIILFFSFYSLGFAQGEKVTLKVPIRFKIEHGDIDGASIKIIRDGGGYKTMTDLKKVTMELEFGHDYQLVFSKPGYVTKKVIINTKVSEERAQDEFAAFAFDLVLFKQYDGVNTIVFNQPIAKISFNEAIDEFDYDVDYTKSIQSALAEAQKEIDKKVAEEKVEMAEKAKADAEAKLKAAEDAKNAAKADAERKRAQAAEEAKKAADAAKAAEDAKKASKAAEEATKLKAAEDAKKSKAQLEEDAKRAAQAKIDEENRKKAEAQAAEELSKKSKAEQEAEARRVAQAKLDEEANKRAQALAAEEEARKAKKSAAEAAAEEVRKKAKADEEARLARIAKENEEKNAAAKAKSEEDAAKRAARAAANEEAKKAALAKWEADRDAAKSKAQAETELIKARRAKAEEDAQSYLKKDTIPITSKREEIQEKNRSILLVTITRGEETNVYKKVQYKYGIFYFKDDVSITKILFDKTTAGR